MRRHPALPVRCTDNAGAPEQCRSDAAGLAAMDAMHGLPEFHALGELLTPVSYVLLPATCRDRGPHEAVRGSYMRHFGHIAARRSGSASSTRSRASSPPTPRPALLAAALGATLYSPATRPRLADDILKQAGRGVVSMVLCLEDSIDDAEVAGRRGEPRPAVRRPRPARPAPSCRCCSSGSATPEQIPDLVRRLGPAVRLLSGFVLPEVHRGARRPLPGGARPTAEAASGPAAVRDAGAGVARAAAPGDPRRDPRRASPAPSTSTASGCWRCASA